MSSEISRIAVEGTPSSSLDTDRGRETDREASVSRWETGPESRETDRETAAQARQKQGGMCVEPLQADFLQGDDVARLTVLRLRTHTLLDRGSRQRDRERTRDRQQAERHRHKERQADRETGGQASSQPGSQTGTQTHTHTERDRQTETQGERQKETEAETERQAAVEGGRIPCRRRRKCPHRPSRASGMPPSTQHSSQRSRCSQRATAGADFSCAAPSPCVRGCAWLPLSQPCQEFLLPPTRPEPLSATLSVSLALAGSGWLLALSLLLTRAGTAENPLCLSLSLFHSTAPPAPPAHSHLLSVSMALCVCVCVCGCGSPRPSVTCDVTPPSAASFAICRRNRGNRVVGAISVSALFRTSLLSAVSTVGVRCSTTKEMTVCSKNRSS